MTEIGVFSIHGLLLINKRTKPTICFRYYAILSYEAKKACMAEHKPRSFFECLWTVHVHEKG